MPWAEVTTCIRWCLSNISVVSITPGSSQSFYVCMTEAVYISLKVHELQLQSSK